MLKKLVFILPLTLCLVLLMTGFALAAELSDIRDHWAGEQINKWADGGLTGGYADGTFKPDREVSRAEFVALTNRAFGIGRVEAAAGFGDVKTNAWYYDDVAAAKANGYIGGYTDGSFKPDSPITRQEAAGILIRLLDIAPNTDGLAAFTDAGQISDWARGNIGAVAQTGLMGGMPDNTFRPLKSITRAEAVVSLDRALEYMPDAPKPAETAADSAVAGKVAVDGRLIEDAVVRVFNAGSYDVLKNVKTGADGVYKIALEPGYYDITAVTEKEVAYQSNLQVTADKITTVDLALVKAAVISGILKDSEGQAVKNATLIFTTNPTFVVTTNSGGEYTAAVLPNRTYTCRAYEPGKENNGPVIVDEDLGVGGEGQHNLDTLKASFSGAAAPAPGGGGGGVGGGTSGDTTPPVLDSVQYTLNGQSRVISKNASNHYTIDIPSVKSNKLTRLKITVVEESQTSLQVTGTDIGSINIAKIIDDADLDELEPVNGKITIDLGTIALFMGLVDFSQYPPGTQKYIEFKLTDASGNKSNFRVVVNVVAA